VAPKDAVPALTKEVLDILPSIFSARGALPSSFSGWEPKRLWSRVADGGVYDEAAFCEGFDSTLRRAQPGGRRPRLRRRPGAHHAQPAAASPCSCSRTSGPRSPAAVELELRPHSGTTDAVLVRAEGLGVFSTALARGFSSAVPPTVHLGLGARARPSMSRCSGATALASTFGPLAAKARPRARSQGGGPLSTATAVRCAPYRSAARVACVSSSGWGSRAAAGARLVQLFTPGCKPLCRRGAAPRPRSEPACTALGLLPDGASVEDAARALGATPTPPAASPMPSPMRSLETVSSRCRCCSSTAPTARSSACCLVTPSSRRFSRSNRRPLSSAWCR